MSEHIVHTAVLEDSFAIASYLETIPPDFREVINNYLGFARLGCITVSGDQFSFRLLEEYKPKWHGRDTILEAKLAFVLGWISHRACDRQMKPIWQEPSMKGRGSDVDPTLSPTECSVYHEGKMYNLYFSDNSAFRGAIFKDELKAMPGADAIDLDLAAQFVQDSFAVNLMNIQTIPTSKPQQDYFEEVCMRTQKFYVDISRYTRSAGNPDPELTSEYLTDINWIDTQDKIIAVAQKIRRNETPTKEECALALAEQAQSHYGKALQLSLSYIIAAAEYFNNDSMTMEELKDRLDIGKKGPGGLAV